MFEIFYALTVDDFRVLGVIVAKRMREQSTPLFQWATRGQRRTAAAIAMSFLFALIAITLAGNYGWIGDDVAKYASIALLAGLLAGVALIALVVAGARFDLVRPNGPLTGLARLTICAALS